ncbi:MAG: HNH endonuclease [Candidatus Binataceae bacterium]
MKSVKTTLYSMAGGVTDQFENLIRTLRWIDNAKPRPNDVRDWLQTTYGLSDYFARDVYTVILVSSGLITVPNGRCLLTRDGRALLDASSPAVLLEIFENQFAGVAAVLEVLRGQSAIPAERLTDAWFGTIKDRYPQMKDWNRRTLSNQCRHRTNWLRAMGFVEDSKRKYSLSEAGWKLVLAHPPEAIGIQKHEVMKQEKKLRNLALGKFEGFDASGERKQTLREAFVRDGAFRDVVVRQYEYHCAMCDFRLGTPQGAYEAEAAHIIPKSKRGSDDPRNGMCLCGVHHWAFDEGVISVRPEDLTVIVATFLTQYAGDVSVCSILELCGRQIRSVANPVYRPAAEAFGWHNENIFLR